MINYEEIADEYNYNKWKSNVLNYIEPMLKEPWYILSDFITKDDEIGYSLRMAYDQSLDKDEVLLQLYLYRIIDHDQYFGTYTNKAQ